MEYKQGQYLFLRNSEEECIGVIVNAGTEQREQLSFAGVTKNGYNISIPAEHLKEWNIINLNDKIK
jgi:hypothetical protein